MLQEIAIQLRAMQLFAHNGHNLVTGPTFFSDHEFLSKLYEGYTESYDSVVEKAIGTNYSIDLQTVTQEAAMKASLYPDEEMKVCSKIIGNLLSMENSLIALLNGANATATFGTQDLLQSLASEAESRKYLMLQRMK